MFTLRIVSIMLLFVMALPLTQADAAPPAAQKTSEEALQVLKEGNARFAAGKARIFHADQARRAETAGGQAPFATVLACSDSRVPVELLFNQGIGDLFIVRVAGNVADTDEIGSLEYGVGHLKTPLLVVLGHTRCGAVTAVAQGASLHGSIPPLVDNILPALKKAREEKPGAQGDALIAIAIRKNILQALQDIITRSDEVRGLLRRGTLKVIGALYDIETGSVLWLGEHPDQKRFLAGDGRAQAGGDHAVDSEMRAGRRHD